VDEWDVPSLGIPIPGTRAISECLVTSEVVCTQSNKEAHMDESSCSIIRRVVGFVKRNSFRLVVALSLSHIGLAYIDTRDSGRADSTCLHMA
jgi:hypothetical protein